MKKNSIKRWFYKGTYNQLRTKCLNNGSVNLLQLTAKELRCLIAYEGIKANNHNDWNPNNDIDFIESMKKNNRITEAQKVKLGILSQIAYKALCGKSSYDYP